MRTSRSCQNGSRTSSGSSLKTRLNTKMKTICTKCWWKCWNILTRAKPNCTRWPTSWGGATWRVRKRAARTPTPTRTSTSPNKTFSQNNLSTTTFHSIATRNQAASSANAAGSCANGHKSPFVSRCKTSQQSAYRRSCTSAPLSTAFTCC